MAITVAVPPFDLAETQRRFGRKHILNWKRSCDPTTVAVATGLSLGYQKILPNCGHEYAATMVAVNWVLWRMGGNTKAWMRLLGFSQTWDASTRQHVRLVFQKALVPELRKEVFYAYLWPPSELHHPGTSLDAYWEIVDEILQICDSLFEDVCPTLVPLARSGLPWALYLKLASGLPSFGTGGSIGYCHSGFVHTHPKREAGFWAKELLLDLMESGVIFPEGYAPPDRYEHTGTGWGGLDGLSEICGIQISLSQADAVFGRIFQHAARYGWGPQDIDENEDLVLHDLQWNSCEGRKFHNESSRLRRYIKATPGQGAEANRIIAEATAEVRRMDTQVARPRLEVIPIEELVKPRRLRVKQVVASNMVREIPSAVCAMAAKPVPLKTLLQSNPPSVPVLITQRAHVAISVLFHKLKMTKKSKVQ